MTPEERAQRVFMDAGKGTPQARVAKAIREAEAVAYRRGLERAARKMEERAEQFRSLGNQTGNTFALVYESEADVLRMLREEQSDAR